MAGGACLSPVTLSSHLNGNKKGRVLTDWTWLEETGETGPKMPATPSFISSHSFLLACMQVNELSTTSVMGGKRKDKNQWWWCLLWSCRHGGRLPPLRSLEIGSASSCPANYYYSNPQYQSFKREGIGIRSYDSICWPSQMFITCPGWPSWLSWQMQFAQGGSDRQIGLLNIRTSWANDEETGSLFFLQLVVLGKKTPLYIFSKLS